MSKGNRFGLVVLGVVFGVWSMYWLYSEYKERQLSNSFYDRIIVDKVGDLRNCNQGRYKVTYSDEVEVYFNTKGLAEQYKNYLADHLAETFDNVGSF